MKQMLPKLIGALLAMAGSVVMIGWILNVPSLTTVSPTLISMKFNTALSFFLGGFMLYFLAVYLETVSDAAQIIVIMTANIILLVMGTLLVSFIFRLPTGMEMLFVKEVPGSPQTIVPGAPSLGTMLGFVAFAISAILMLTRGKRSYALIHLTGAGLLIMGIAVIVGYAAESSLLKFQIATASNPVAINTAILFCLAGAGFLFLGNS